MSKNTVLITGINGFVGEHVARELKGRGLKVVGVGHDGDPNTKVEPIIDSYIGCDLLDETAVENTLSLEGVSAIIHLAGLAAVGQSFDEPQRFMTSSGIMTHNLLERASKSSLKGRVVVISTGALYKPNQALPLDENSKTHANSPYAVGKLMAEDIVQYHRTRGVDSIIVRPFNHIGPGQGQGFLLPDLYEQLSTSSDSKSIKVGNIDTKRDYTDVRDIARAYADLALANILDYEVYNVCSGRSISGRKILELLMKAAGVDDIEIVVDESKIRPTDIQDIYGDASRLERELNWRPEIAIEQTIEDFVASNQK